ncbi:hypothetical protein Ae201684P_020120 [Aphanomyces euteiches]|nr:hypothetical protein Ae201684P_020120 [Aphanomyces euteiches]
MSNNPRGNIFRHVGIYQVCVVKSTEVEMESESVMDLVPFQAPRLAGSALSFFAALTRLPGLGSILLNKVKTDNQFHVVREFASTLDNMPVYLPLRPPTADVLLEHFRLAWRFPSMDHSRLYSVVPRWHDDLSPWRLVSMAVGRFEFQQLSAVSSASKRRTCAFRSTSKRCRLCAMLVRWLELVKPSLVQPPPFVLAPTKDLGKLRVGVFTPYAEPSLLRGYRSTIEQLKELGAEVIEVEIPHLNAIHLSHNITSLKEFVDFYDRYPISSFSPDVQINLGVGNVVDALEYLAAQKVRGYAMQVTEEMFDQVDIFLTPATAQLAPRLDRDVFKAGLSDLATTTALMRFIILGNMVGIPGLTVPVAYDMETNLTISVLLQAIHLNEHKLFAVARHLEAHMLSKEPSVYYSVLNA